MRRYDPDTGEVCVDGRWYASHEDHARMRDADEAERESEEIERERDRITPAR